MKIKEKELRKLINEELAEQDISFEELKNQYESKLGELSIFIQQLNSAVVKMVSLTDEQNDIMMDDLERAQRMLKEMHGDLKFLSID